MLHQLRQTLRRNLRPRHLQSARGAAVLAVAFCMGQLPAVGAEPGAAKAALQEAYVRLGPELHSNVFGRPLVMRSEEGQGTLQGEVYAIVNFPLAQLNAAVASPAHWCDVMILHINTKYCRVYDSTTGPLLTMNIGKKTPQTLPETTRMDFQFTTLVSDPAYLNMALSAEQGPMGTSNYQIVLEAAPLEDGTSFLHLTYAYDFNVLSRMALGAYLSTLGTNKVGFSRAKGGSVAAPVYIQGMRAMVERNTMRYFLAINAYLESAHGPEGNRLDARLQNWFAATEAYPRQLREVTLQEYLAMKHDEVLRQGNSALQ